VRLQSFWFDHQQKFTKPTGGDPWVLASNPRVTIHGLAQCSVLEGTAGVFGSARELWKKMNQ
jgi:hypothetical protein